MNIEVYCDESGLEALANKTAHKYVGIGGIWIPADKRATFKEQLNRIKAAHNIHSEIKWKKVSPKYIDFYINLIDYFFALDFLRFRVILIEAQKVDNCSYNDSDNELSFYKFYYQLLHHWIFDYNQYDIFLDLKVNRNKGRLNELHRVLSNANLFSKIKQVQGLPSEQSAGIQLADFFTGLVTSKMNNEVSESAKFKLIKYVEKEYLRKEINHTSYTEEKFNIFKINLRGEW
ncbi:DUF3800 domain-containing protein [Pontibacter sp. JH31]|uniref:DUF3800 domain-containing protein n=1 Tax=Pontibacter aquaedesilientis TaxID=2766980 RepID=A0ABR7XEN2_9BACT|nr:DUF3800 domain-containing protein [Pontibacter aquaedesilientis]MBD1396754.1 DUF3800 domain-containing protein [Pontibacter aquaedesilientis]